MSSNLILLFFINKRSQNLSISQKKKKAKIIFQLLSFYFFINKNISKFIYFHVELFDSHLPKQFATVIGRVSLSVHSRLSFAQYSISNKNLTTFPPLSRKCSHLFSPYIHTLSRKITNTSSLDLNQQLS